MNYKAPWQRPLRDMVEHERMVFLGATSMWESTPDGKWRQIIEMALPNSTNGNDIPDAATAYRSHNFGHGPNPASISDDAMCVCGYRYRVHDKRKDDCIVAGSRCMKFRLAEVQDA